VAEAQGAASVAEGLVARATGSFCDVYHDGRTVRCVLRGRLRGAAGRPVPGDRVQFRPGADGTGVLEAVLPRRTVFTRWVRGARRIIAANVEQAVVVFAAASPEPEPGAIDRFLALAEAAHVAPVLCVNKADLADPAPLVARYRPLYPVLVTSARTGQGLDELRARLAGRISVVVGPSGVGKSTLLNALQPGLRRRTGELSPRTGRGRHTTTVAELLPVAEGFIVDTPGVQVLELEPLAPEAVDDCFPEIAARAAACAFRDCLHLEEPACAVKAAVAREEIAPSRYRSYLALLEEVRRARRAGGR